MGLLQAAIKFGEGLQGKSVRAYTWSLCPSGDAVNDKTAHPFIDAVKGALTFAGSIHEVTYENCAGVAQGSRVVTAQHPWDSEQCYLSISSAPAPGDWRTSLNALAAAGHRFWSCTMHGAATKAEKWGLVKGTDYDAAYGWVIRDPHAEPSYMLYANTALTHIKWLGSWARTILRIAAVVGAAGGFAYAVHAWYMNEERSSKYALAAYSGETAKMVGSSDLRGGCLYCKDALSTLRHPDKVLLETPMLRCGVCRSLGKSARARVWVHGAGFDRAGVVAARHRKSRETTGLIEIAQTHGAALRKSDDNVVNRTKQIDVVYQIACLNLATPYVQFIGDANTELEAGPVQPITSLFQGKMDSLRLILKPWFFGPESPDLEPELPHGDLECGLDYGMYPDAYGPTDDAPAQATPAPAPAPVPQQGEKVTLEEPQNSPTEPAPSALAAQLADKSQEAGQSDAAAERSITAPWVPIGNQPQAHRHLNGTRGVGNR